MQIYVCTTLLFLLQVISGSEWGNLLVWEDRLIKLEVRQKAKGNCHNAAISQIHFNANTQDLISVGLYILIDKDTS